ncbi:MAG: hypothetical protein Q9209_007884 [Squamulea sp. 1 TL-2023]
MALPEPASRSAHSPNESRKRKRFERAEPQKQRKIPRSVGVNSLPWNAVPLPDNLDDAEGFFGLEEISDVEIVRDEKLGRVEYRHLKPIDAGIQTDPALEDNDWNGCDDSDPNDNTASAHSQTKAKVKESLPRSSLKKHRESPSTKSLQQLSAVNGFQILRDEQDEENDVSAWQPLHLSPQVLASLAKLRFKKPTAIQSSAIPEILRGQNVIGKASTGSGKTLAFGIPILEHYLEHGNRIYDKRHKSIQERKDPPVALIISPTRELAQQLSDHTTKLCSGVIPVSPRIATIVGDLSIQKQQRTLANADIIIGTPGRLWDHISSSKGLLAWLQRIKFLVLDEADRLLSQGHFKELENILDGLRHCDPNGSQSPPVAQISTNPFQTRQTLIFSATFSPNLNGKLSGHRKASRTASDPLEPLLKRLPLSNPPTIIDASPNSHLPTSLTSYLLCCDALEKDLYLYALVLTHFPDARILVFANSTDAVRRLVPFLSNLGLQVYGLYGNMPQKARLESFERFSAGKQQDPKVERKGNVLVATDIAARGLDIPFVHAVIHYHLPDSATTYVHRSGRTARQGNAGISVLICAPNEVGGTKKLIAQVHAQVDASKAKDNGLRTLELNRQIVSRLKERTTLAKKIADVGLAKPKAAHEENLFRRGAEELGAEYDSEEFAANMSARKGKGKKRRMNEQQMAKVGKGEIRAWKAELNSLLARRVNVGVSERYLSAGGIDVEALLEGRGGGEFLGEVERL